uniref:S1 motif domain-containing protein n=1 Tax=Spumella elongata TaxID=89044 RepID=A0A7S3GQ48_9STRA
MLEVGQTVKVRVAEIDLDKNRISLSMRMPDAARASASDFEGVPDDQWFDGVVVTLQNYGAFIKLTSPSGLVAQGLLPNKEIADTFVEDPGEYLEMDMEVKVRIVSIDKEKNRISLSMLQKKEANMKEAAAPAAAEVTA